MPIDRPQSELRALADYEHDTFLVANLAKTDRFRVQPRDDIRRLEGIMDWIYFDEIEVPSRTEGPSQIIDRDEMVDFARTWDPLPIHLDAEAARAHGGLTASGPYLLAFRIRLIHQMERKPAIVASFGYEEVRFQIPAHAGDELTLFLDFEKKRLSSSKPDRGIVTVRQSLVNQDGAEVLTVIDTILVRTEQK